MSSLHRPHPPVATAVAVAASLLTSGCAIVGSSRLAPDQAAGAQGVAYMLPMARVPVSLIAVDGQVALEISEPVTVADPDHVYVLRRVPNPFSSDTVTIDVDPATGFLTKVEAKAEDKTLAVLEKLLLKGPAPAATPESAAGAAEVLYKAQLDPANAQELRDASQAMTQALRQFLGQQGRACTQAAPVCAEYQALAALQPEVKLEGRVAGARGAQGTAGALAPADCAVGVCYRQAQPFLLAGTLGGRTQTTLLNIPNAAPLLALPIERHAFVTTQHTLTFSHGTLSQAKVERPSSALALASSPLAAASAVLRGITEPLSELLKIDTSGEAQAAAQQNIAEAQLQHEAVSAQAARQADATAAVSGTPPRTLATLTLGSRRSSATGGLVVGPPPIPSPATSAPKLLPGAEGKK